MPFSLALLSSKSVTDLITASFAHPGMAPVGRDRDGPQRPRCRQDGPSRRRLLCLFPLRPLRLPVPAGRAARVQRRAEQIHQRSGPSRAYAEVRRDVFRPLLQRECASAELGSSTEAPRSDGANLAAPLP
eukprot:1318012-Rhodomonas_salina.2